MEGYLDQRAKATGKFLVRSSKQLDTDLSHIKEKNATQMAKIDKDILDLRRQLQDAKCTTQHSLQNHAPHPALGPLTQGLTPDQSDFFRRLRRSQSSEASVVGPSDNNTSQEDLRGQGAWDNKRRALLRRRSLPAVYLQHRKSSLQYDEHLTEMAAQLEANPSHALWKVPSCESVHHKVQNWLQRGTSVQADNLPKDASVQDDNLQKDTSAQEESSQRDASLQQDNLPRSTCLHGDDLPRDSVVHGDGLTKDTSQQGFVARGPTAGQAVLGTPRRVSLTVPKTPNRRHSYSGPLPSVHTHKDGALMAAHQHGRVQVKEQQVREAEISTKQGKDATKGIPEKTARSIYQLRRLSRSELRQFTEEKR